MKKNNISQLIRFSVCCIMGCAIVVSLFTQRAHAADAAFDTFWSEWKSAVAQGDKAKVASMVQYPLELNPFVESLKALSAKDERGFVANYDKIFVEALKRAMAQGKPMALPDTGDYQLNYTWKEGPSFLMFRKVGGRYKLVDINFRG